MARSWVLLTVVLSAQGAWAEPPTGATTPAPASSSAAAAVRVERAWSRATPPGARAGAGYLTLVNPVDAADRLMSASSTVAGVTEVHEMSMTGGVMRMRHLADGLIVPARGSAVLAPGGIHLMFLDLRQPLVAGQVIRVQLRLERAGVVPALLRVEPIGSKGPAR
jgi:copper(I)-binding protein